MGGGSRVLLVSTPWLDLLLRWGHRDIAVAPGCCLLRPRLCALLTRGGICERRGWARQLSAASHLAARLVSPEVLEVRIDRILDHREVGPGRRPLLRPSHKGEPLAGITVRVARAHWPACRAEHVPQLALKRLLAEGLCAHLHSLRDHTDAVLQRAVCRSESGRGERIGLAPTGDPALVVSEQQRKAAGRLLRIHAVVVGPRHSPRARASSAAAPARGVARRPASRPPSVDTFAHASAHRAARAAAAAAGGGEHALACSC
mmetsp:Transcript_2980/g.12043  ORF Transcript_2980/g.12043 Transcript_2980/m.12043 type:complete len:260 (-) Transcript_2980:246-1025(-)